MSKKDIAKKPLTLEEASDLRADRDDALGYTREQFDFGDEKGKPVAKKRVRKKKQKPKRK
ncbi:MAG TPA: hypothetical protein VJL59_07185 [Anaerolineales bacterium]|nr:hypothetical protein [Anaerolineales bacterium]